MIPAGDLSCNATAKMKSEMSKWGVVGSGEFEMICLHDVGARGRCEGGKFVYVVKFSSEIVYMMMGYFYHSTLNDHSPGQC